MPEPTTRLDRALVDRDLARSRGHARELVDAGLVLVDGRPATKTSAPVGPGDTITVDADAPRWVSRAAGKLAGALDALAGGPAELSVEGRRCLDLGACTGGFTQVLLEHGAAHVVALDVGHDQLAPVLADDPRVTDRSGTTLRGLRPADVDGPFEVVVGDLSFISLRLVLPEIRELLTAEGEALLLVKPQFEVGRERLGRRGVVTDPRARRDAVMSVLADLRQLDLATLAVLPSTVPGGEGNREYLVRCTRRTGVGLSWQAQSDHVDAIIEQEAE